MSGFAYPVPIGAQSRGMTLRDQAALAALQGLLAAGVPTVSTYPRLAEAAWAIALAWEVERERVLQEPTP